MLLLKGSVSKMSSTKKKIRVFVRLILGCREKETISDCIARRIVKLKKRVYKRKFGQKQVAEIISSLGIKAGDTVIVHCAWREFFNYEDTPESIIDTLIDAVGENGNILMPAYGDSIECFDLDNTKSAAGVLSEVFRTQYPTIRSCCNHFSMLAYGPMAKELTQDHIYSINGFDDNSPYYKTVFVDNSKILLIGLGRKPKKFSMIHTGEFKLRDTVKSCADLLNCSYKAKRIYTIDGVTKEEEKEMLFWKVGKLQEKTIATIYDNCKSYRFAKISNLSFVKVDCDDAWKYIIQSLQNGTIFTV